MGQRFAKSIGGWRRRGNGRALCRAETSSTVLVGGNSILVAKRREENGHFGVREAQSRFGTGCELRGTKRRQAAALHRARGSTSNRPPKAVRPRITDTHKKRRRTPKLDFLWKSHGSTESRPTGKGIQKIFAFLLTVCAYMLIFAREDEAHRAGRQRDEDGGFPDHPSRRPSQCKPIQAIKAHRKSTDQQKNDRRFAMNYSRQKAQKAQNRSVFFVPQYGKVAPFCEDFPGPSFSGKNRSQGNVCQGNGKSDFKLIPLTMIPLTSRLPCPSAILHPPSSLWLRLAAPGVLSLFAAN